MKVTLNNLEEVIKNGENDKVEFKLDKTHPKIISKLLAGFANARGGTIVFGISEVEGVVGCDTTYLRRAISKAMELLSSPPHIEIYDLNYNGKPLLAVDIENVKDEPISVNGAIYVRQGAMTKAMPASSILQAYKLDVNEIKKDKNSSRLSRSLEQIAHNIEKQTATIESQSTKIEKLEQRLKEANSLKSKIRDWIIGGLIGAIFGTVLGVIASIYILG
ncbi:hypothetical protein COJ93_11720 [Bacillus anthracis]|nr:hypothetical protein CON33_25010 [Bacillus anthracis]PFP36917.1 hypothetical protein COJ93_11720 [Bacillus anthracis]